MATFKPRSRKKAIDASRPIPANGEERRRMITEAAYYLAERRGFVGGSAESDWLQAEREIDRALQAAQTATRGSRSGVRAEPAPLFSSPNR